MPLFNFKGIFRVSGITLFTAVSAIFIGISTFKPFDCENITADCGKKISIGLNWGRLEFYQYFHFKNNGKAQGTITSFKGLIKGVNNNYFKKVDAKYVYNGSQMMDPYVNITLNPDDYYYGDFDLTYEYSKDEKDTVNSIKNSVQDYLDTSKTAVRLSNLAKSEILDMYSDFKEGTYQYIVVLYKENEAVPFFVKCYSFTIFRSDLRILNESIKNYTKRFFQDKRDDYISITLTPITDKLIINNLYQQLSSLD